MKNPCKFRIGKYVVKNRLKIRFGKVLGSFVGGSGTVWGVSWALLGAFCRFFLHLKSICFATLVQHGLQEPVGTDFGRVLGGSGRAWGRFLDLFYQISFNFWATERSWNRPLRSLIFWSCQKIKFMIFFIVSLSIHPTKLLSIQSSKHFATPCSTS